MQHTEARHTAFAAEHKAFVMKRLKCVTPDFGSLPTYVEWLEAELEAARAEAQEASIREVDMPY